MTNITGRKRGIFDNAREQGIIHNNLILSSALTSIAWVSGKGCFHRFAKPNRKLWKASLKAHPVLLNYEIFKKLEVCKRLGNYEHQI